jgi:hypothetical protein
MNLLIVIREISRLYTEIAGNLLLGVKFPLHSSRGNYLVHIREFKDRSEGEHTRLALQTKLRFPVYFRFDIMAKPFYIISIDSSPLA